MFLTRKVVLWILVALENGGDCQLYLQLEQENYVLKLK